MVSVEIPACLPGCWEDQNPPCFSVLYTGGALLRAGMCECGDVASLGLALSDPSSSPQARVASGAHILPSGETQVLGA